MTKHKRVLTVDFWNTLYNSGSARQRNAYRQLALVKLLDTHASRTVMGHEIEEAVKATWGYFERIWKDEERTIHAEESVYFLLDTLKVPETKKHAAEVIAAFEDSVLVHPPYLMEGAKKALENIATGYGIALISDTGFSPGRVLRSLMERDSIDHLFAAYSFSDETGVSNPHAKAFHTALAPFGLEPHTSIHIGDIEHTDIKGAKGLGMRAIRFTGNLTEFTTFRHSAESHADHQVESWAEVERILLD